MCTTTQNHMCAQGFSLNLRSVTVICHCLLNFFLVTYVKNFGCFTILKNSRAEADTSVIDKYLLMRSPDLKQQNTIVQSLYKMKNGTMNMSRTVQNQTARYIFSLMTFCDKTHKPLWFWGPPAAPTFGTVQLTLIISREEGLKIQISVFVFSLCWH